VAYPVGGQGKPEFIVLEMHYDNPQVVAGDMCSLRWRRKCLVSTVYMSLITIPPALKVPFMINTNITVKVYGSHILIVPFGC